MLGFQFHPEMTPATLELLLENEEELSIFNGEYVQPVSELQYSEAQNLNKVINS